MIGSKFRLKKLLELSRQKNAQILAGFVISLILFLKNYQLVNKVQQMDVKIKHLKWHFRDLQCMYLHTYIVIFQ